MRTFGSTRDFAAAAFVVTFALTSCGGGGGGGSTPAAPAVPPGTTTPPPAAPPPVTTVPSTAQYALNTTAATATYAAGTAQEDIFRRMNELRGTQYGYIAQSAALDAAAQAHADYLKLEIERTGALTSYHGETPGQAGFTGATVADRVAYAKYSGQATEIIGGMAPSHLGRDFIDGQLKTIYHAATIQGGLREVGIGVAHDTRYNQYIVVVNFGVVGAQQYPAAGNTKNYPVSGQTNVIPQFEIMNEIPRPLPELTANAGHPAFFGVRNVSEINTLASQMIVNAFEMKDAGGNTVPALLMVSTGSNVASALSSAKREDSMLGVGSFYLVPTAPLATNATYTVTASVTTPVTTYTKSWSFTTGVPR